MVCFCASRSGETHQQHAKTDLLTTNQGIRIADNQNSLKVGTRGPVLLEDFVLRGAFVYVSEKRLLFVVPKTDLSFAFPTQKRSFTLITNAFPSASFTLEALVLMDISRFENDFDSQSVAKLLLCFAMTFLH